MKYLLDSMVWVWLANAPQKIPSEIVEALNAGSDRWGLSAVSVWEIARKASLAERKPKHPSALDLKMPFRDWVAKALDAEDYFVLPLTPEISAEANALPAVAAMI